MGRETMNFSRVIRAGRHFAWKRSNAMSAALLRAPQRSFHVTETKFGADPRDEGHPAHYSQSIHAIENPNYLPTHPGDNALMGFLYRNLWMRTPMYALWFIITLIVLEIGWWNGVDLVWSSSNPNKSFEEVIPSRFPNMPPDTGDEEDEDDDDDDEDDEEDDDY